MGRAGESHGGKMGTTVTEQQLKKFKENVQKKGHFTEENTQMANKHEKMFNIISH